MSLLSAPPAPQADRTTDETLLVDRATVASLLSLSTRTLDRLISTGRFPKADIDHGPKLRRWRRTTVENWCTGEQAA